MINEDKEISLHIKTWNHYFCLGNVLNEPRDGEEVDHLPYRHIGLWVVFSRNISSSRQFKMVPLAFAESCLFTRIEATPVLVIQ